LELEKSTNEKAAEFATQMTNVLRDLRHKTLAFAIKSGREKRRAEEIKVANEQLANDAKLNEAQIKDLHSKQVAAQE